MITFKKISCLTLLITSVSCTQMLSQRSYLTEMEHDDSTFFNPRQDFPVVNGDTGRDYETASNRRARTPSSEQDIIEDQNKRFLRQELKHLEARQNEESAALYEKYKRHLSTTSERIYFLKLSSYERKEYLSTRGFMNTERALVEHPADRFGVRQSDLAAGMNKSDVVNGWGRPNRVEVAGNPSFENERWLYNVNGATKYIYFESGRVEGWE